MTVNNVAPTVVVSGASPVNESQTAVEYTFTTTDPGTDTFSAGTPGCGASGSYVVGSLVFSSVTGDGTFECLFADDDPTATASDLSTVSITITDDDTGATTGSKIVTVNNVAPTTSIRPSPSTLPATSLSPRSTSRMWARATPTRVVLRLDDQRRRQAVRRSALSKPMVRVRRPAP